MAHVFGTSRQCDMSNTHVPSLNAKVQGHKKITISSEVVLRV